MASTTHRRASPDAATTSYLRNGLFLGLLLVGLYVLLPKLHSFRSSFQMARHAQLDLLLLGLVASFLTYGFAAGTYWFLALQRLSYARTLLIELANLLINRIVPAGIGGLGLNYEYLRTNRHTVSQAVTVVTINNVLGLVGHGVLLALLVSFVPMHGSLAIHVPHAHRLILIAGVVLTVIAVLATLYLRNKLLRAIQSLLSSLLRYKTHPQKLVGALASSMVLTVSNATSFWLCCRAVDIKTSFVATFIVFSIGVLIGTATPTPGGLGGVEASLVAGLVSLHVVAAVALAAVLTYRLLSYWLPLVVGLGAFWLVQKRQYVVLKH